MTDNGARPSATHRISPKSYRKNRGKTQEWAEWVRQNRNRLHDCGVPSDLYADKLRWFVFIDHCYDQWTDWSIDDLSESQSRNLFDFLINEYGEGHVPKWSSLVLLLDALECRFAGSSSRMRRMHNGTQES